MSIKFSIAFLFMIISQNVMASLIDRGNGLIYDTDLDITWLSDANLASTQTFGVADIGPDGSMFGATADEWVAAMNTHQGTGYLGFNSWRLTTSNCATTAGHNCTDSEFGHLFYIELGGVAFSPISDSADPDLSLFSNIVEDNWYWTGSLSAGHVRVFDFGDGAHSRVFGTLAKNNVWAVLDGDVAAVPIPSTIWLFISGIAALITIRPPTKSAH